MKKLCGHFLMGSVLLAAGFGVYSCSDTYDLDTKQPSGLNSIYGYMKDKGNYTNYLHLIDDLGQAEILSKTGSKTMFIANDEAFSRFYASNKWGVKSYEGLSLAQKKLLLNSSMIDNPYSTSMLSTAEGPVKGEVCRRSSSLTLYDSVTVVASHSPEADAFFPNNPRFDEIRANHDTIAIFTDASNAAPMLHFNAQYLAANKIASSDIDFIYNQPEGTRQSDDVYVNNSKVVNANIFCKNGFIHEVDQVVLPLDNMAEVIRKNPKTSKFSSILERFAAVDDSLALTRAYNVNKGTDFDTVFIKRYFSDRSFHSSSTNSVGFYSDKNNNGYDVNLKFDPGWNGLIPYIASSRDGMMEDMAAMLVPTDEAFMDWYENSGIKNSFPTLDDVPSSVLVDLIKVNQLPSFCNSVPSRFKDVLNDASEEMGINKEDIDSVALACNGVVYLTNKAFLPTSFKSVLWPTVIFNDAHDVIKNAIDGLDYAAYLNSMVSNYIFIVPTNDGMLTYVDPVSYGSSMTQMWEFHCYTPKQESDPKKRIYANVFRCSIQDDGTPVKIDSIGRIEGGVNNAYIKNRIENILDNIIITEAYQPGKQYYKTKGNTFVKVDGVKDGSKIWGTWQTENNNPLIVKEAMEQENGYALRVDGIVMGTRKSVAQTISEIPEFSEFYNILTNCNALNKLDTPDSWWAGDQTLGNLFVYKTKGKIGAEGVTTKGKATYLLNNYHYTMYIPTNDAMQKAFDAGLPTIDDLNAASDYDADYLDASDSLKNEYLSKGMCKGDSVQRIQEAMLDFVKYHIQDNSVYVDGSNDGSGMVYESAKTKLTPATDIEENVNESDLEKYKDIMVSKTLSEKTDEDGTKYWNVEYYTGKYTPGRTYELKVVATANSITVNGDAKVEVAKGLYNISAREYWYTTSDRVLQPMTARLNNASSVVIHGIDTPLLYDAPAQFKYKYKPVEVGARTRK